MAKTIVNIGFRTQYKITTIDKDTQQPIDDTVVCNIVLHRGQLALGDVTSYSEIALGTSAAEADYNDTGLGNPVATLPLSVGTFEQINRNVTDLVTESVIRRTFIFKDFIFPSNIRTLDLNEIGLSGRTRAVFPETITIDPKTWVKVDLEIIYTYTGVTSYQNREFVNDEEGGTITYDITPIIFNPSPTNDNGKGYGQVGALRAYLYDGNNPASSTYSQSLGTTTVGNLHYDNFFYEFHLTTPKMQDETLLHGFVIRDVNNGVGFLITLTDDYYIQEDDSLDMAINFYWGPIHVAG